MNSSSYSTSNFIDIFEIYRRYCDIRSSKKNQNSKEALTQLLKLVELRGQASSLYNDLSKLMSYLDLTVDSGRFACFYDFVFFMCRENGQKNITLEKAIVAWKLVLNGRFRLLNEWCNFVEKHQRHNVSEDTWQQILAFSRCVHEDLEGYDPKGAWPVLIDDFVDYMHRIGISNSCSSRIHNRSSSYEDFEDEACKSDDGFPGLALFSGSKRKSIAELYNSHVANDLLSNSKRCRAVEMADEPLDWESKPSGNITDAPMEIVKHGSPAGSSKNSACAVEGSLLEGFAGLLSTGSCMQFDQKARIIHNVFLPH
ncbi:Dcn1-like protein [Thalictrum thalictroides]|uniref:Defective in cullin neddylation protein n=1 Tax=Thalictrum thalictroides TaxID=46969 RepID=A0A7J6XGW4_THATH|nr:Dcn1-like protein [Thalictrum thalictroides]